MSDFIMHYFFSNRKKIIVCTTKHLVALKLKVIFLVNKGQHCKIDKLLLAIVQD